MLGVTNRLVDAAHAAARGSMSTTHATRARLLDVHADVAGQLIPRVDLRTRVLESIHASLQVRAAVGGGGGRGAARSWNGNRAARRRTLTAWWIGCGTPGPYRRMRWCGR
jgi:hypothetical protein